MPAYVVGNFLQFNQALGLTFAGGEVDFGRCSTRARVQIREFAHEFVGLVNARFRFRGTGFRSASEPLDFRVHAVLQRFLSLFLGVQKFFFLHQKLTVISVHAQNAVRIHGAQFGHFCGHIFQKVPVMADDHARKAASLDFLFEPLDAGEVQMIGRLIEQQNIGNLDQRLHNGQPLTPAS